MTQDRLPKTVKPGSMRGFSLIELAIVMTILGVLLSGLLIAIGQSTENTRRITARNEIRQVMEALYGFAQTNGRLPCPARHNTNGYEDPVGGGTCTGAHGMLPSATLNLAGAINGDGLLLDPWGNPYRYSVSMRLSTNPGNDAAFTSSIGLDWFYNNESIDQTNMLRICNTSTCADVIQADTVPAMVLSMGSNWGSYTSNNEIENGGNPPPAAPNLGNYNVTTTNDFVSTDYSEQNFDDIILWLSPHVLFSKMISAGKLP